MTGLHSSSDFGKPINRLGVIASLATHGDQASKDCINLFNDTEGFVRRLKIPKVSDLTFIVDGAPIHARNTPKGDLADLTIWAVLGYLPYSVVSQEKRMNLLTIIEGARSLDTVKFGIDREMRIVVSGVFEIPNPPTPNYVFVPLVTFLQQARPFMTLIGDYL